MQPSFSAAALLQSGTRQGGELQEQEQQPNRQLRKVSHGCSMGRVEPAQQQPSHYISSTPSTPSRYAAGRLLSPPSAAFPSSSPSPSTSPAMPFRGAQPAIPRSATVDVAAVTRRSDAVTADTHGCLSAPSTPDWVVSRQARPQRREHDRGMPALQAGVTSAAPSEKITGYCPSTSRSQEAVAAGISGKSQSWSAKSTPWHRLRDRVLRSTSVEVPRQQGGAREGYAAEARQSGKQLRSVSCSPVGWRAGEGGRRERATLIAVVSEDEEERESDGEEGSGELGMRSVGMETPKWVKEEMKYEQIRAMLEMDNARPQEDGRTTTDVERSTKGKRRGKGRFHAMAVVARAMSGVAKKTVVRSK